MRLILSVRLIAEFLGTANSELRWADHTETDDCRSMGYSVTYKMCKFKCNQMARYA